MGRKAPQLIPLYEILKAKKLLQGLIKQTQAVANAYTAEPLETTKKESTKENTWRGGKNYKLLHVEEKQCLLYQNSCWALEKEVLIACNTLDKNWEMEINWLVWKQHKAMEKWRTLFFRGRALNTHTHTRAYNPYTHILPKSKVFNTHTSIQYTHS